MQTILIVDDDPEIREGIRILLSGEDFAIIEAENGHQALKQLTDTVDLVILDVMMPGISGLRTCAGIRQADRADSRRRRLSCQTVFILGADRARQSAAATILCLSGKSAKR